MEPVQYVCAVVQYIQPGFYPLPSIANKVYLHVGVIGPVNILCYTAPESSRFFIADKGS